MRDIKFKVWDKINNKMYDYGSDEACELLEEGVDFMGMSFLSCQPNVIWLQYTGIEDKDGKSIYEGDIVEKTYYSYHQPECSELFEIKYEGLGFYFEHIKGNAFYLPFTEDIEIIGNIYENPELINKEEN